MILPLASEVEILHLSFRTARNITNTEAIRSKIFKYLFEQTMYRGCVKN